GSFRYSFRRLVVLPSPCPRDQVSRLEIGQSPRPGCRALRQVDLRLDRRGDAARDLVLDVEEVGQRAIVTLRPDMVAALGFDQLRRHAEPVPRLAYATFHHIAYAQLLADALHLRRFALVGERR